MRLRRALLILAGVALAAGAWLAARSLRSAGPARVAASPTAAGREEPRALPHQLTPERLKTLAERLLGEEGSRAFPRPPRNIFRPATTSALAAARAPAAEPPTPDIPALVRPASELSLTGFVERSGPEGKTECLAVFRFEGEVHLVREGESVGAYVVEKILNGEEVRLVERATGTRRVFRIE